MAPLVAIELSKHAAQTFSKRKYSRYYIVSFTAVINHTRPSAQKRLDKTYVLVEVSRLTSFRLYAKIYLKPCSSPLVQIIILFSVCTASSVNTLALI